jgi:uncharacterized membrane protein YfcA
MHGFRSSREEEHPFVDWPKYVLIVLAGVAAGFVNILAGNGSLITLPALLFFGLPANVANATNRVGVVLQNVVGVAGFHQQGKLDLRGALIYSIPATLGAILGAYIAVDINEEVFRRVLAVVMVLMLVLMLVKPERWVKGHLEKANHRLTPLSFLIFFAIGVYGGFLQAGVGIFLLVALVLNAGYDVVRGNAVKVFIVLALTLVALAIFQANGQVQWDVGLLLGAGNMVGAWLATRFAAEKGAVWVRRFVIVVVLVSAAELFGVFDAVQRLLA